MAEVGEEKTKAVHSRIKRIKGDGRPSKNGEDVLVEISPKFFSTWDFGKRQSDNGSNCHNPNAYTATFTTTTRL